MSESEAKMEKMCIVMTGFSCNNNCVVCSVKPFSKTNKDNSTAEIISMMKKKKASGAVNIEFTGGEPTMRKDIVFLVQSAKKMGFHEIALSTNARLFSYEPFLNAMIEAGLTRVTATLDGGNEKLHDAITRTPGSFKQTTEGVKKLVERGITTSVNTVFTKFNVNNFSEIAEKLIEMRVPVWGVLDLIPDGNIKEVYRSSCVSFEETQKALRTIYSFIDRFDMIELFDFPVCVIPSEMYNDKSRVIHFDAFGRMNILDQVGYDPQRFEENDGVFNDEHKMRVEACAKCKITKECGGIWRRHYERFGDQDIEFTENNYLK